MYLVGDELTVTGLQLAGLKRARKADECSAGKVISEAPHDALIVLVTQTLAKFAVNEIAALRRTGKIVVEIPDMSGAGGADVTERLVREAVGFNLKV